MLIDIKTACEELISHDNFLIFAHQKPDGDTLGSSFALMWALQSMGKKATVKCYDNFPARYNFIYGDFATDTSFTPEYLVAADVASTTLICQEETEYSNKIDLCIDHHKSNTLFAKKTLLDVKAPAACQVVYEVIVELGVKIDKRMASALFTGISTDTGCFRFANATAKSHRVAADVIELGAEHNKINKLMFDSQTRGMVKVSSLMLDNMTFYFQDRCAIAVIPQDVHSQFGVTDDELDGLSALTTRIDGILAGITVRVKQNNTYRISLRTVSPVDASRICSKFGGGGHVNAAGCTLTGEYYEVIDSLLNAVENEFRHNELG